MAVNVSMPRKTQPADRRPIGSSARSLPAGHPVPGAAPRCDRWPAGSRRRRRARRHASTSACRSTGDARASNCDPRSAARAAAATCPSGADTTADLPAHHPARAPGPAPLRLPTGDCPGRPTMPATWCRRRFCAPRRRRSRFPWGRRVKRPGSCGSWSTCVETSGGGVRPNAGSRSVAKCRTRRHSSTPSPPWWPAPSYGRRLARCRRVVAPCS